MESFRVAIRLTAIAVAAVIATASCQREADLGDIRLPPTTVLSVRARWGVIQSHLLRVREEPTKQSTVLQHVRRGNLVEILSRTDRVEEVEGKIGYWYLVNYMGLKGWVFGAYLEIADSESEAQRMADSLE